MLRLGALSVVRWGCLPASLLCGCALGPAALEVNRVRYNEVIQRTANEQLLLNLVRLQYREAPLFLEVGSVSAQFNFSASADVGGTLNEGPTSINPDRLTLGAGIAYVERPTITFAPLQGEDFVNRILSPLRPEVLMLLSRSGWSIDRVLRLTVQSMNGLDNASGASGPTPDDAPEYEQFADVAGLFRELQKKNLLELGNETVTGDFSLSFPTESVSLKDVVNTIDRGYDLRPSGDGRELILTDSSPSLVWRIPPEAGEAAEVAEIVRLLGLRPKQEKYQIRSGLISRPNTPAALDGHAQINLTTRSLMGVLFYLSQSVEVPQRHRDRGWVTTTRNGQGQPFDWARVTGGLLRVHAQAVRPRHTAVAVQYLGHWYYIDNADLKSKSTLGLLSQLFALQAGDVQSVAPVLTLPVGG